MPTELIKELLEAGVHFGHQTKRWNPKMKRFIFGKKSGIYIIDLEKSVVCLEEAQVFLKDVVDKEKTILFVGTKKQAKDIIKREAERCGMFYISERWIGGLLTNFAAIGKRIERLKQIKKMEADETIKKFTKKEASKILKEKMRLQKNFGGVEEMPELPGAVFLIDAKKEENAIREARKLSIPIVALIDTNSDPDEVDYPIPGNDDAIKSIELITSVIAETVLNATSQRKPIKEEKEEDEKEEKAKKSEKTERDIKTKSTITKEVKTKKAKAANEKEGEQF